MNYLSHIFLAGTDYGHITGALMGDFLRGVDRDALPLQVQKGIEHHMAIDCFTDTHEGVKSLKPLFPKPFRRFSGIILDVTFDHLLHKEWDRFAKESATTCIERSFRAFHEYEEYLPLDMLYITGLLKQHRVLYSYAHIEGVGTALRRIGDRFRREAPLADALPHIKKVLPEIESVFTPFFEELQERFAL